MKVEQSKIIEQASGLELQRARAELAEMKLKGAKAEAAPSPKLTRALWLVVQVAFTVVSVVASAAACHRLMVWGWQ